MSTEPGAPQVASIQNYFDVGIVLGDDAQNFQRAIRRMVVDDVLLIALRKVRKQLAHTVGQNLDVASFVAAGTHDADKLHLPPFPSSTYHAAVRRMASCRSTVSFGPNRRLARSTDGTYRAMPAPGITSFAT